MRLLIESALIVVSILAAFGIDTWWSHRGERAHEAEVLVQITEDFRRHERAAEGGMLEHRSRAQAGGEMLQLIGPRATVGVDEALSLWDRVCCFNLVTFPPGMLETVLSTDGLSIVRDEELRSLLVTWSYLTGELPPVQNFVISESEILDEYLTSRWPQRRPGAIRGVVVAPSDFAWEPSALFGDLEFENLVFRQAVASQGLANRLERLAGLASQIVEASSTSGRHGPDGQQ